MQRRDLRHKRVQEHLRSLSYWNSEESSPGRFDKTNTVNDICGLEEIRGR